jgi:hypothetical protein
VVVLSELVGRAVNREDCGPKARSKLRPPVQPLSVKLPPALLGPRVLVSKEHQNFVAGGRYILATISLKLRAQVTKSQGGLPKAQNTSISLVRLPKCTDHATLVAA